MYSGQIYIVLPVIFIVLAFTLGFAISKRKTEKQNTAELVGSFIINHTDPTKDLCTLHLDVDLDVIEANKFIKFNVVVIDDSEEELNP